MLLIFHGFSTQFQEDSRCKTNCQKVQPMNQPLARVLFFCVLLGQLLACSTSRNLKRDLNSYVQTLAEQKKFSGSVLVAKDGEILLNKGYGMANYEHDVANTPHTKFRLASITKQFTAMAVMQLYEQGLLKLDDKLSKYIPDYPHGDKIAIHHLLTHTSGVAYDISKHKKNKIKPHTLEQLIERFKYEPLQFEPGERYQYSNAGYILLSYIIEKASGKTYETFLKENIFIPLSMNDSGYDISSSILKNRASGYSLVGNTIVNSEYINMSVPAGAGALYSTVEDLYAWDRALYTEKLLSKKSLARIFNSHISSDFPGYGYGWITRRSGGRFITEHLGFIDGFSTNILRYPDDDVFIVVLSNYMQGHAWRISNGLAAIIFKEKYIITKKPVAISVDPAIYDQYVGHYRVKDDYLIAVSKENNRLFAKAGEQVKIELTPASLTDFFQRDFMLQITFVKDQSGKVTGLVIHGNNEDNFAERL